MKQKAYAFLFLTLVATAAVTTAATPKQGKSAMPEPAVRRAPLTDGIRAVEALTDGANQVVQLIIQYTNQERTSRGLPLLTPDSRLSSAAQHHAKNMAERDTLSHTLTEADLPQLSDRISHYGYDATTYGENIAYGRDQAQETVNDWMNSPGHRANILNENYRDIGVGVAYYQTQQGYVRPYYCQVFGAQAPRWTGLTKDKPPVVPATESTR